ncbi:MAG: TolC family protein [Mariprofundaceae bacterium]|nr:TolC family protein [Mariprofundaceae bacterium]
MQHSKGFITCILGCLIFTMPLIGEAQTKEVKRLSLEDAVKHAVTHNPMLAAQGEQARAMREIPAQVGSLPDPVLSFNLLNLPIDTFSPTQENMTQSQFGLSQALPFPGTLDLRASVADLLADAASYDTDEFKLQVVYRVKNRWWNIFYLDRALETVEHNQQLLRQLIKIAEIKYKVGKGLQQDVLLAQLELSKLLDVAIQLKASRRQEQAVLNALLNQSPHQSMIVSRDISELLPRVSRESDLFEQAVSSRPLLAKNNTHIAAAQQRIDLAEQDYYPNFNLAAAYGIRGGNNPGNGTSRSDFASIRLNMTLPFFTRSKQDHQLGQRQAELARAEFSYQDSKEAVLSEISQALAVYDKAKEQSMLFKQGIIPQAKQTVASMLAGYQVNKVDFLNLVRAQVTLYNYETQYWKALASAKQSLARLDAAVGRSVR